MKRAMLVAVFMATAVLGIVEAELQSDWMFRVTLFIAALACAFIAGVEASDRRRP